MNASIWKTPLSPQKQNLNTALYCVLVPDGAKPLCVQMQGGWPTIWWYVDIEAELRERQFRIVGTGWEFPEEEAPLSGYVGTVQEAGGALVWHVFEV